MIQLDIAIVGAGGAGMYAALEAGKTNPSLKIGVLSKVFPTRSHTGSAQGGVNAVLKNVAEDDSIERHIYDTIKGSDFLADQNAVKIMCQEAPKIIYELEHLGASFSRLKDGRIAQRPFGGASRPRTCYAADRTGHVILQTLYEQCLRHQITFFTEWFLLSLVHNGDSFVGLTALNIRSGDVVEIQAKAVILATGGFSRIYWTRTSNALGNTGDGTAAAFRAGLLLKDMEFIQFHPTGLRRSGVLITEGARGEGAYLLNKNNERFMENYAPERKELAPRDLVSRAIETEIREGRAFEERGEGYVHLDLTHLGGEIIKKRLPQIRDLSISFEGIDPIDDPIPVKPTAHYAMGGIHVDENGQTPILGIFAAGESSCISVHGANRLGGNSLLEILVFGKRAGKSAAEYATQTNYRAFPWTEKFSVEEEIKELLAGQGTERVSDLRTEMGQTMAETVGIFRDKKQLERGLSKIRELQERLKRVKVTDRSRVFNTNLIETLELKNLLDLAEAVAVAAIHREESRGSHYRTDFRERDDKRFLCHQLVQKRTKGLFVACMPVNTEAYSAEKRTY